MYKILNRHELLSKLTQSCVLRGEFVLNSGARADVYFDKYRVTTDPHLLASATVQLANLLFSVDDQVIGQLIAPELGGAVFATALQQYLLQKHQTAVELNIVRSKYIDHGTGDIVLGRASTSHNSILVDDVITSGKAVLETIHGIEQVNRNIQISQIVALVDRGGEGVAKLRELGYLVSTVFSFDEIIQKRYRPDLHN